MSRIRIFTAFAALAACMCLGIGTASATGNGSSATQQSNGSIVSNEDAGNLLGSVNGNAHAAQQTATGGGAANSGNTAGVKGNTGTIGSGQANSNRLAAELYY